MLAAMGIANNLIRAALHLATGHELLGRPRVIFDRDGKEPYLSRWYLTKSPKMADGSNPWTVTGGPRESQLAPPENWGLYLHRFHKSDEGDMHNHPWRWAVSLVLAGGYVEDRRVGSGWARSRLQNQDFYIESRRVEPGDINVLTCESFHRVELLEEDAWSLFLVGPKFTSWGFWQHVADGFGKFTPWRQYITHRRAVNHAKEVGEKLDAFFRSWMPLDELKGEDLRRMAHERGISPDMTPGQMIEVMQQLGRPLDGRHFGGRVHVAQSEDDIARGVVRATLSMPRASVDAMRKGILERLGDLRGIGTNGPGSGAAAEWNELQKRLQLIDEAVARAEKANELEDAQLPGGVTRLPATPSRWRCSGCKRPVTQGLIDGLLEVGIDPKLTTCVTCQVDKLEEDPIAFRVDADHTFGGDEITFERVKDAVDTLNALAIKPDEHGNYWMRGGQWVDPETVTDEEKAAAKHPHYGSHDAF